MKPEIENLKVWMSGKSTTGYQRALAMREFEQLLTYVAELEQLRQPLVMPSGFTLKQENAIWAIIQYLAKDQFQNPKRVYKRKDVFDLIKAEMDW